MGNGRPIRRSFATLAAAGGILALVGPVQAASTEVDAVYPNAYAFYVDPALHPSR